jgi:transcriptional regulator of arginine metabolism
MADKARRRAIIMEILSAQSVPNQDRLQKLLASRGLEVTQATLSRDLRDLNVFKGPSGYVLNQGGAELMPTRPEVETAIRTYMISAVNAGNLVVLRTRPGHASPLAGEIDRSLLPGVAGTIAGDDTVFVAMATPARARALVRQARATVGRP